jgi:two-component system response regulator YesN
VKVVVVDNDPDALDLAALDLRLDGHDVVAVGTDGEAAIRLCEEHRPDVLVVDHRMPPGPWGLDVARAVVPRHPGTRVIIYSNYRDGDLPTQAAAAGATFLPKGNLRSLRRAVRGPSVT